MAKKDDKAVTQPVDNSQSPTTEPADVVSGKTTTFMDVTISAFGKSSLDYTIELDADSATKVTDGQVIDGTEEILLGTQIIQVSAIAKVRAVQETV